MDRWYPGKEPERPSRAWNAWQQVNERPGMSLEEIIAVCQDVGLNPDRGFAIAWLGSLEGIGVLRMEREQSTLF